MPSNAAPLIGQYVRLEGLCKAHIPQLFRNLHLPDDKSIFDWLPWTDPTNTEDELWNLFERLRTQRGFMIYAIKAAVRSLNPHSSFTYSRPDPEDHGEPVGTIGYLDVNTQYRTLEIGAVLFGPSLRRSAAATEAHYLLLRNACESHSSSGYLPYRRIAWKCDRLHSASRKAAERLGFLYEGTFRNHMISHGHSRDSDLLSVIEDEWPDVKRALETWLDGSNFNEQGKQLRRLENIRATLS